MNDVVELKTDNPPEDLKEIISSSKWRANEVMRDGINEEMLLEKLVIYIANRDIDIFDHGFNLGIEKGKENARANQETRV